MKKMISPFLGRCFLSFFIVITLFTQPLSAQAETLNKYQQELLEYQARPLDRAQYLRSEANRIREVEEGLARQYGIPVSRVLDCGMIIEKTINLYHSIYFIQRKNNDPNPIIFDDRGIEDLSKAGPPYSYLMYLNFMDDMEDLRQEKHRNEELIERSRNILRDNLSNRSAMEKRFRLYSESISKAEGDIPAQSWELLEVKARLELCEATQTLYTSTITLTEANLDELKGKLEFREPLLDRIRKNIKFEPDDFAYLNATIFRKNEKIYDAIDSLDKKYRIFDDRRKDADRPIPFIGFCLNTGQKLIRDEVLLLLDLAEGWSSLRLIWRDIQDLLEGNLDLSRQKNILSGTAYLIDNADRNIKVCSDAVQEMRAIEQEATRRFNVIKNSAGQDEIAAHSELLDDLTGRRARYLSYMNDLGAIREQYSNLQKEAYRILKNQKTEEKIQHFWYENFLSIFNTELWHIDDYPVTLGKLAQAFLIFFMGLFLTQYVVRIFRKKTLSNSNISEHGRLLLQKALLYTGIIGAFLFSLWSLNIPLTAFAFLGGAAVIALGLGTQRFAGDIFSGIILLFQKKLRLGDVVVIGDQQGVVEEITLYNTILRRAHNDHLIIPNSRILEGSITNLTLNNAAAGIELSVSISYTSDLSNATAIIADILNKHENVLKNPPFKILFEDFGQSAVMLTAQFFINVKQNGGRDVCSSIRHRILDAFGEANIEIPLPKTEVYLKNDND